MLFSSGLGGVALGKALSLSRERIFMGAPGHGQVTFAPAIKASVVSEGAPTLSSTDLGQGFWVQAVVHGSTQAGVAALEVIGGAPAACVELRIWDAAGSGGWRTLATGPANALGAWNWSGVLPKPLGGAWELALHFGNGPAQTFRIQEPGRK
jgi:hypothetical protein